MYLDKNLWTAAGLLCTAWLGGVVAGSGTGKTAKGSVLILEQPGQRRRRSKHKRIKRLLVKVVLWPAATLAAIVVVLKLVLMLCEPGGQAAQ